MELKSGVYFIYAANQNKVKIGRSKNIEKRFRELRTGFMDDGILLLGILSNEEVELESILHKRFAHLRANGEWFYLTKELDDFILNCHFEYGNITKYNDLKKNQKKMTYNSLGMYKFIRYLKNLQNKYLVPLLIGIAGLIIAIYNFTYSLKVDNDFMIFLSYFYFIILPLYLPFLAKEIIAYQSIKVGITFFVLIAFVLIFEFSNLLLGLNDSFLSYFRIITLSVCVPFMKNIGIMNQGAIWYENQNLKAKEKYIRNELSPTDKIKNAENLLKEIHQLENIQKRVTYIVSFVTIVILNLYCIFYERRHPELRFAICFILDFAVSIWWFVSFLMKKKEMEDKKKLIKIKSFIIPLSIFIVLMTCIVFDNSFSVFGRVLLIILTALFPVSLTYFATMWKIDKAKINLKILIQSVKERRE